MDQRTVQSESDIVSCKNFVFVDEENDGFRCVFCKKLYRKQFRLACAHFICRNCKNSKRKGCPTCGISHEVDICVAITDNEKQILDLRVRCSNQNCNYENNLEYFQYLHTVCKWSHAPSAASILNNGTRTSNYVQDQITHFSSRPTSFNKGRNVNENNGSRRKAPIPLPKQKTYSEVLSGSTRNVPNLLHNGNVNNDINEVAHTKNHSLNELLVDESAEELNEKAEGNTTAEQIQERLPQIIENLNLEIDKKLETFKIKLLNEMSQNGLRIELMENVKQVKAIEEKLNYSIENLKKEMLDAQKNKSMEDNVVDSLSSEMNERQEINYSFIANQLSDLINAQQEIHNRNVQFEEELNSFAKRYNKMESMLTDYNSQIDIKIAPIRDRMEIQLGEVLAKVNEQNQRNLELTKKMEEPQSSIIINPPSEEVYTQLNESEIMRMMKLQEEKITNLENDNKLNLQHLRIEHNKKMIELKDEMKVFAQHHKIAAMENSYENISQQLKEMNDDIKDNSTLISMCIKKSEEQKQRMNEIAELVTNSNESVEEMSRSLHQTSDSENEIVEGKSKTEVNAIYTKLTDLKQRVEYIFKRTNDNEEFMKEVQLRLSREKNITDENLEKIALEVKAASERVNLLSTQIEENNLEMREDYDRKFEAINNKVYSIPLQFEDLKNEFKEKEMRQKDLEINLTDRFAAVKQEMEVICSKESTKEEMIKQVLHLQESAQINNVPDRESLTEIAKEVDLVKDNLYSFSQQLNEIQNTVLGFKEEIDSVGIKQEELETNLLDQQNIFVTLKQRVENVAERAIANEAVMNRQNQSWSTDLSENAKEMNEVKLTIEDKIESISCQLTKQIEENALEMREEYERKTSRITSMGMKQEELESKLTQQQHMFADLEQQLASISEQVNANEASKNQLLLQPPSEIYETINENMERVNEIANEVKAVNDRVDSIPLQLTQQIEGGISLLNQKIESDNEMMELNYRQFTKQIIEENILEINNIYKEKFASNEDRINFIFYHLSDKIQGDFSTFKQNEIAPIEQKWQKMETKFIKYYEEINENIVKEMLILKTKSENELKAKQNFELKLKDDFTKFSTDTNKILKENEDKLRKQVSEVKLDLKQLKSNSSSSFSPIELHPFHTLVYVWEIQQIRTKLKRQKEIYTSDWFRLPGYPFIACGVFENQCCRFRLEYQADNQAASPTDKAPFKKVHPKVTCVLRDLSGSDKPRDVFRTIDCLKSKKNTIEKFDFGEFISSTENANSVYVRNEAVIFEIHVETPSLASKAFSHNGVLFDIIENYQLKKEMEKDYLLLSHKSPYFYTSTDGYRVQVFVCLHAVGNYEGYGLSAVVRVLTGENDFSLPNSLMHTVTFTIFNQHNPTKHLIRCVEFDIQDENFRVDFQSDRFIEKEGFIKNDALFYKVVVQKVSTKKPKRSFLKK